MAAACIMGASGQAGPVMSLTGRLLHLALPLLKLRTRFTGVTLGVRALATDKAGRILLVRHSYLPGWHFPGGGVEVGETACEAASRELAEEGGLALSGEPRLRGIFRNPEWTPGNHIAFFEAGPWAPCPTHWGVEIEAAEFFTSDALPPDVHPSVRRRLAERDGAAPSALW
jgi:ADP-ribose pyrophosphatase YjhB (NUDIX family)